MILPKRLLSTRNYPCLRAFNEDEAQRITSSSWDRVWKGEMRLRAKILLVCVPLTTVFGFALGLKFVSGHAALAGSLLVLLALVVLPHVLSMVLLPEMRRHVRTTTGA